MIKPLGFRVLVELDQGKERSRGGLYIPEAARDERQFGYVLAFGHATGKDEDGNERLFKVSIGDRVLIPRYSSGHYRENGKEYAVIEHKDILGVWTEGDRESELVKARVDSDRVYDDAIAKHT
jgi:chaperonin GroES